MSSDYEGSEHSRSLSVCPVSKPQQHSWMTHSNCGNLHTARPQDLFYGSYSHNYHSTSQVQINLNQGYFSCVLRLPSRLPRNYGRAGHPKGSETSDISNRCRWIQGLCSTGRKDQLCTLPMNGSSYKYHNYIRFGIQTHLFAVLSTSVAFINWQPEEAIAVTVNREAAANVQNGISSSTYRK